MKKVMGKYSIADPSGFKQKLKNLKKKENADRKLNRQGTKKSDTTENKSGLGTSADGVSQSKLSGVGTSDGASSRGAQSDKDSDNAANNHEEDEEHAEEKEGNGNKVLPTLNNVFTQIHEEINKRSQDKLNELKKMQMMEAADDDFDEKDNFDRSPLDELVDDVMEE